MTMASASASLSANPEPRRLLSEPSPNVAAQPPHPGAGSVARGWRLPTISRETRWIAGFAFALIVAVWIAVALLIVKARSQAIAENYREEYASAAVFAEQATRTIRLLDSVMQLVAHELAKSPTPNRLKELADEKVINLDTLVLMSFVDAEGRTVGSTLGPDVKRTDLSDREHIRAQLDRRIDGLFVGKPVLGRVSGKWSIQLTRRVEDAGGHTLGVLVASIDPHYFERFWSRAEASRKDVDELIGLDGVVRARSADVESALADRERRDAIVAAAAGKSNGFVEMRDREGRAWLTAFVRLEELPLLVSAAVTARSALAQSWPAVATYASFGAAMSLMVLGFSALLIRLAEQLRARIDQAQLAEKRMRLAIETIPDGFALFDADDRLTVCNEAYRKIYTTTEDKIRPGTTFEELLRAGLERGQYVEARGREAQWLEQRVAEHRNPSRAFEQLTDAGRWLRIEERRTADGSIVGLRSDITALKQREFELARQTALLQTTLQNIGEGVAVYDKDRKLIAWNDLCADLLQTPRELFRAGATFDRVIRFQAARGDFGPMREAEAARRIAAFHTTAPWTRERRRQDGRAIEVHCRPMPDGGAVFLYRDLTERSDYESRLNEALRKAQDGNRAKSEFLAMISHEIRTPMNAIIGMSSLLGERDLEPTEQRYAQVIREAGEKLLAIIEGLLDFSRLESGRLALETKPFDVRRIVASVVEIARAQPNAATVDIAAFVDPAAPALLDGDGGRISQIMLNLVGNAVKFTAQGSVTIRVRLVGDTKSGEMVLRCEIEDTGPGIAPSLQERLFHPFERGPTLGEPAAPGTGLGLAICRRLVDLMQGQLGVESEVGSGSTFWFEIPVRAAPPGFSSAPGAAASKRRSRSLKILVAEDIEANRTVIGAMLQKFGHDTDMVEDGEQAVAAALAGQYDVILMDVQMPRMNGLDAIRAIRQRGGHHGRVPIVAVTAFAQESDREEAMNAGADGYLTKPVRTNELRSTLDGVAGQSGGAESAPAAADAFDESALAELREDLGDESFERLLGKCVEDVRERLDRLKQCASASDGKQIRAIAHQLKGLFAQFGALAAAAAASATELGGEEASADNLAALERTAAVALQRFETMRSAGS